MFLHHSSRSFSQQVFPSFVCYEIKLILLAILKQVIAVQDIYFIPNNENVLIQNKKADSIFTQNNVQHNKKHTLDHRPI